MHLLLNSDGVLEDMTWALRTHFQVLGLGLVAHVLGLDSQVLDHVKFSMTHRCTDTAAKKVLMILAKTIISVSSFPP